MTNTTPELFASVRMSPFGLTCCLVCDEKRRMALPFPENIYTVLIVCPTCGNKRCPKATHHDNTCGNSNAAGQLGSWYGGHKVMPSYNEALAAEENAHFLAVLTDFGAMLRGDGDDDELPLPEGQPE